jgi:hypothetical protein
MGTQSRDFFFNSTQWKTTNRTHRAVLCLWLLRVRIAQGYFLLLNRCTMLTIRPVRQGLWRKHIFLLKIVSSQVLFIWSIVPLKTSSSCQLPVDWRSILFFFNYRLVNVCVCSVLFLSILRCEIITVLIQDKDGLLKGSCYQVFLSSLFFLPAHQSKRVWHRVVSRKERECNLNSR